MIGDVLSRRRFVTGDVLVRRRFVTETFCRGDVLLGDVLSRRRFVRRRFVCASEKPRCGLSTGELSLLVVDQKGVFCSPPQLPDS